MENKFSGVVIKAYFMLVAVLMYYFVTQAINLGLFISYRHAFALLLFVSALFVFLLKPNVARGASSLKGTFVYSLPLLVSLIASLFIWFVNRVDTEVISRGLSSSLVYTNLLSCALAAVAFLYIFGEKGIWYNLLAILISNMLMLATIIAQYGLGAFLGEFVRLVVSFADDTGDIIVQAEIHELAFCLGAYLIYMFLKPRKNIAFYILLALTCFCFLTAFKRIGIIAIVLSLAIGWILKIIAKFNKQTAIRLCKFISIALVFVLIGYVFIIKMGVFSLLEEAGIDTTGRDEIYSAVDKFYEFSPEFLGNGIGFLSYQLTTNMKVGVLAVHNDFLQYFIDLGFFGYILWLITMTFSRVSYFGSKGNLDGAVITLALTIYLVISSSTDNTVNFPLLSTVLAIIMIGHGFDEKVRVTENKMFGYISEENRETEGGGLL